MFDKDFNCLANLRYWSSKHWKYLESKKGAKAKTNLVELKFGNVNSNIEGFCA